MIQKMPEFTTDDTFKTLIETRFKETALKAFLCRAARTYDSFSISSMSESFALSHGLVLSIVNRMILKGKIQAHLDAHTDLVVMDDEHKVSNEAKELQQLSMQYSDKLEAMIENNERLIDMLAGGILYSQYAKEKQAIQAEKAQAALDRSTSQ